MTNEVYTDDKLVEIRNEIRSIDGAITHKRKDLSAKADSLSGIESKATKKIIEQKIDDLSADINDLEESKGELEAKIKNPARIKLTKEQFLNLAKNWSDKMRAGDSYQKDALCRILFLNLTIDNKIAPSVIWREPFASLVKALESELGGRGGT